MSAREEHVSSELPAGARLGAWEVRRLLSRGGSGEVYLAARADGAFQQTAALKLLQSCDRADVPRFQSEREILARLTHPGIARLLDGGVHRDGRPYMVVEYVDGLTLTDFCDAHRLDLAARLRLFMEVCEVVSYAHRSLIVHRDLKPRNILVTADGRVKLLDFGVAKRLDTLARALDSEKTSAPLTPDYAAPEQLTGQAITTAADVYALGVLLFELLTARKPFRHTGVPVAEAVRAVLQEEAPTLSRVARSVGRPTFPPRLLEGDLDAIVAKCLRKEPEHRYESVEALRADVQHFLNLEPVAAREGARIYVLGRFLRRHRWMAAAGAAVFLALSTSLALVAWQAHRVGLERDIARRAASREEAVRYYLTRMFRASVAEEGSGPTTAKAMLDRSARRVLSEYRDDPYLAGKVVETLADLYGALEDFEGQVPLLEGFLAQAGPEADAEALALVRQKLANVELQRGNTSRAAELLAPALQFWETDLRRYAEQHLEGLVVKGRLQRALGDLDGAIATYRAALNERIALSGRNHPETAALHNSLAIAYMNANRFNDALAAYSAALAVQDVLGRSEDLDALIMRANVGILTCRYGRIAEAENLLRNAFEKQRALAGDSAAVASAMGYYGSILTMRGQWDAAIDTLTHAVEIAGIFAGPASPVAVLNRLFLAEAHASAGNFQIADRLLAENLELGRKQLGEENVFVLRTHLARSRLTLANGRPEQASAELDALIPRLRAAGVAALPALAQALVAQGEALLDQGRASAAVPLLTRAVQLREQLLWDQSWELAEARARLGEALGLQSARGRALLASALTVLESQLGPDNPQTQRVRRVLAG